MIKRLPCLNTAAWLGATLQRFCCGAHLMSPALRFPGVFLRRYHHFSSPNEPLSRVAAELCPECGKPFWSRIALEQHRRGRHRVVLRTPQEKQLTMLTARLRELQSHAEELRSALREAREEGVVLPREKGKEKTPPAFPAAVQHEKVLCESAVATAKGPRIGVGAAAWVGVGIVVPGSVRVGRLAGRIPEKSDTITAEGRTEEKENAPEVLEFTFEMVGYRERRTAGQQKQFRNRICVRYHFGSNSCTIEKKQGRQSVNRQWFRVVSGDLLRVQGFYALHTSFDVVSRRVMENVTVEADAIGVLRAAPEED